MASKDAIKAGEAFVELSADDSMLARTLARAVDRIRKTGDILQSIGKTAAIAGAGLLAPLVGAFTAAISHADGLQDIADRMESTTEAVSRLSYAADFSASKIEDVEKGNQFLTKSALAAANGAKEQAEAFAKMGIAASDFLELDVDERFIRIAQTLEDLDDPLERNRFLLATLGKSYTTLLPLLNNGVDGLRRLFDEAEKTGSIVDSEDAQKSAEAMDMIDKAVRETKNTIYELGRVFLDFNGDMQSGSKNISEFLWNVRYWIRENRVLIASILLIGAGLVAGGVALITFGAAMKVATALVGVMTGAFTLLGTVAATTWAIVTSPITLVAVGITAITLAIAEGSKTLQKFGRDIKGLFGNIGETISKTFQGVILALRKGELNKAVELVTLGIQAIWLDLIRFLREKWYDFTNFFSDAFRGVLVGLQTMFLGLVRGIQTGFLDAILFIVGKVNDANQAINDLFNIRPDFKDLPPAVQTRILTLQDQIQEEKQRLPREVEKRNRLRERVASGQTAFAEPLRDVEKNIELIDNRIAELIKKAHALRESGGKLIDTSALEDAKKNIEAETKLKIDSIKDEDVERKKQRDAQQQQRLNDIEFERDATKRMIEDIIRDLNMVEPEVPTLPRAPMPRVKGQELEQQLGDSVKGLFNSADFQGTLGLGTANSYAKDTLDATQEIARIMLRIENKIEPGVFA